MRLGAGFVLLLLAGCDESGGGGGAESDNARPVAVVDGPATLAAGEIGRAHV